MINVTLMEGEPRSAGTRRVTLAFVDDSGAGIKSVEVIDVFGHTISTHEPSNCPLRLLVAISVSATVFPLQAKAIDCGNRITTPEQIGFLGLPAGEPGISALVCHPTICDAPSAACEEALGQLEAVRSALRPLCRRCQDADEELRNREREVEAAAAFLIAAGVGCVACFFIPGPWAILAIAVAFAIMAFAGWWHQDASRRRREAEVSAQECHQALQEQLRTHAEAATEVGARCCQCNSGPLAPPCT